MTEGMESEGDDLKFEAFGKHNRLTRKADSLGQALKKKNACDLGRVPYLWALVPSCKIRR